MSKLVWDQVGERKYETGVDHGVLYPQNDSGAYPKGVAWNGLSSVAENPSGAETSKVYADNIAYLSMVGTEELGLTIEAYTVPDEFMACDGKSDLAEGVVVGQQSRRSFGLSYRTRIGNDVQGDTLGYKLHLVYNCKASPSEQTYQTVNENPEAMSLSYTITTTPVAIDDVLRPTAIITIDSTKVDAANLKALEEILYGKDEVDPRLPMPLEIKQLFEAAG